jgi:hypothetical protein
MNFLSNLPFKLILVITAATGMVAATWSATGPTRPAATGSLGYHLRWHATLDAIADSTAVVARHVKVADGKTAGVVLVQSGNNASDCDPSSPVRRSTLYAFEKSTGKLLWKRGTTGKERCTTSAPAASGSWVYASGLDGAVHKYDLATGHQSKQGGWPERFTIQPGVEKQSAPLVISGNYLYVTTSGFDGDAGSYDGHVVTINLTTGHKNVWNSLCSNIRHLISGNPSSPDYCASRQAGMFGRGQAAIEPMNGDVYVVTGNGPWNGKTNWGDSVLGLNPSGSKLVDAYTPTNQAYLNTQDLDLGSTGPAILPPVTSDGRTWHLMTQGGKGPATSGNGPTVIRLLRRGRMGSHAGPGSLGGDVQDISSPGGCEVLTKAGVWQDPWGHVDIIYGNDCGVAAYRLVTGKHIRPRLRVLWTQGSGSTSPVVGGNVVYIARDGVIDAYDPGTGRLLWSSTQSGAGGTIGDVHWQYPAVSGDWLFMTDQNDEVYAYKRK